MDFEELIAQGARARQYMKTLEASTGLSFPFEVRLDVAVETIGAALASGNALELALGYVMLRELVDETRDRGTG